MAVPKHPIAHHWVKQTLVPFLIYAFASTLPYPADLSVQIQRAIDFCLRKPDHPSDGDDLVFERIFMAIMHRHKNLAPDLEMVVDNLEPLAKYLIRRAQLKGPYELLERTDVASGAWVEQERHRLGNLALEPVEVKDELRPPMRPPTAPTKLPPTEEDLDPRLLHARPGHFAAAGLSAQLTADEDSYYRRQNQELEQYRLRQQQQHQQQTYNSTVPIQASSPAYSLPGRSVMNATITYGSPYQLPQQQSPRLSRPNSVYTQQNVQQQAMFLPQTTPAPGHYPQTQMLQLQSAPPSMFAGSTSAQPYATEQCPLPQLQPARHSTTHQQPAQYSSTQPSQPIQQPHYDPQLPTTLSQIPSPQKPPLHPHPTPAPTQPLIAATSNDFAHLRGTDWSNAARQRAREIAARVTAHERDRMAQSIMQRQQSIAQAPAAPTSTAPMSSPTKSAHNVPVRPESAMPHPNARHVSDSPPAPPRNAEKAGLPTLQHLSTRYRAEQQQMSFLSSASSREGQVLYGPLMRSITPAVVAPQSGLGRQVHSSMLTLDEARIDALQHLRRARGSIDGGVFLLAPYGGLSTPLLGMEDMGLEEEGRGNVDVQGM